MQEDYLGDGVYARFDGWHIWLSVERENGTHTIAIEPPVFGALKRYAARVWATPEQEDVEEVEVLDD